jgi:serine/threonine-protein kinase
VVPAVSSQVSTSDDELEPGSIVDGRYRIVTRLGGGAMGTVYEAEHVRVGRKVAIKVLAPELAHDKDLRRRFEGEARAASAAGHPGIVQILDAGVLDDGCPYLVMEHLRGRELYSELVEHGPMNLERACRIVRDLARAIHAAHEVGVVHRDLKPENVYVVEGPDGREAVKVLDFGVAFRSEVQPSRLTRPGVVVGTPHYMAPELLDGSTPTHAADIYGMGAILYELLGGHPPHDADTIGALLAKKMNDRPAPLTELRKDVPPELVALVAECLEVDPTLRPASARVLADRLDAILVGTALPSTVPIDPAAHARRSPLLPVVLVAAIAGLVVFTAVLVARGEPSIAFAQGLVTRDVPGVAHPVFVAPMVELAIDSPEPDPVPIVDDPEPDPVASQTKRGKKRGSNRRPTPSVTPEVCDRDRERARNGRREHDWPAVLANTRHASCWQNQDERRRLQIKAHMELGRFTQCIARGKGSTDPEVLEYVKLCERRRGDG